MGGGRRLQFVIRQRICDICWAQGGGRVVERDGDAAAWSYRFPWRLSPTLGWRWCRRFFYGGGGYYQHNLTRPVEPTTPQLIEGNEKVGTAFSCPFGLLSNRQNESLRYDTRVDKFGLTVAVILRYHLSQSDYDGMHR